MTCNKYAETIGRISLYKVEKSTWELCLVSTLFQKWSENAGEYNATNKC